MSGSLDRGTSKNIMSFLENKEIKDIYVDIICEKNLLKRCYYEVSKKKSANTKGTDEETLDSYSKETIETLRQKLLDHSFKFKPIRKIEIPKPNGGTRKLGIPGPRDKVIQRAMVHALNFHYEKEFLDSSHGFRPNRSCHSALQKITGWAGTKWFIEGDISQCFDKIDHHVLAKLLERKVNSKQFMDLYWKAVRSHYINLTTKTDEFSMIGTPQGSAVSPVLANIVLHELDIFMQNKIDEFKRTGKTSTAHPEYNRIHTKISNLRQYFSPNYRYNKTLSKEQENERLKDILKLEKERAKLPSKIPSKGIRIYYVRYADDFLVGVNGPRRIAEELKEEIKTFLSDKLKLTLNSEKTKITKSDERVLFLGAHIKRHTSRTNDQKRRANSHTSDGRKIRGRLGQGRIIALAPLERIVKRLKEQGICKIINFSQRTIIPTRKTSWMNLNEIEIVQRYNAVWQGILEYYSFAYNRSQLNLIQFLLHHSLACTLMNKLKLNSRKQIFIKFGKKITVGQNSKGKPYEFQLQSSLKRINKFSNTGNWNLFRTFNRSVRVSGGTLEQPCIICDSKENVEMHHRRPLKASKTDNTLKGIKINLSRKQIPVCRSCHISIHAGTYSGPGIY